MSSVMVSPTFAVCLEICVVTFGKTRTVSLDRPRMLGPTGGTVFSVSE